MVYSDMERQDFINTINELKAMVSSLKLTISSLKLTIDTLRQTISSQNATISSLQESMDRLQSAYDKAVKDRDEWSSKDDNNNGASSAASIDGGVDQTKVKSENLNCSSREGMNRMNAAKIIVLETSLEGAPEERNLPRTTQPTNT